MILKCLYSFIRGRNKFEMTSKLKFYVEQSTNATLHDKHDHQYGRNIKSLKIRCCFVVVFTVFIGTFVILRIRSK